MQKEFHVHSFVGSALSTARIEELIQEDQNVKRRRERFQRQSSLLSKLTRQLSIHDNRADAASSWSSGGGGAGKYGCMYCRPLFSLLCVCCVLLLNWKGNIFYRIEDTLLPFMSSNSMKFLFQFVTYVKSLLSCLIGAS